jgi:phosphopantothenoylcysteine decarboxylase/phosphopantothenate--cysteine ligase
MLKDKMIVLGVTGSIAVYKAVDIASKLTQADARVDVVMTRAATEFVTPLTFRSVTHRPVYSDMWAPVAEVKTAHVSLAETADILVITPATANIIAKMTAGIADDLLSCTVLDTTAPILIAPAMHTNMLCNPATQENLKKLKDRGVVVIEPAVGRLADGRIGEGRFPETAVVIGMIAKMLGRRDDLAGRRIVISAGGTREPLDPVRYLGNRSSGKMGYALAEAARDRGAGVTLVTAAGLEPPADVEIISVETARQMKEAVDRGVAGADALIMAAAVADYQPKETAGHKIKKESDTLALELVRTPDILGDVKGDFIKVGFAAESENMIENARQKLSRKKLDIIVANDIIGQDSGFAVDTNKVTIIDKTGEVTDLPLMSKREVADKILDRVAGLLK